MQILGAEVKLEQRHYVVFVLSAVIVAIDFLAFRGKPWFMPVIGAAGVLAFLPIWSDVFAENRRQKEIEVKFPEFVRNLSSAIRSGMPAAQAVIHVSDSDYGALTPYVRKLANQLEWSIPFHKALGNFGRETNNPIIRRAIATVVQAEQAGGNIEDVLTSITDSLLQIKKIREERKAAINAQVMQSYIIFFVFLGVMIIIQNLVVPYMAKLSGESAIGLKEVATKVELDFSSPSSLVSSVREWFTSLYGIFLMLSMLQGLFAGMVLGKLAQGDLVSGLKHSIVMMTASFIVITFAQNI